MVCVAGPLRCLQAGIDTFMHRITGLEGDKAALGEHLKRARETVTCLQVRPLSPTHWAQHTGQLLSLMHPTPPWHDWLARHMLGT